MASKRKQRLQLDSFLVLYLASNQNMTWAWAEGENAEEKHRERAKIEANQAWDYAHSTRLVRRFYFSCLVRPIYFFYLLRSLFPGYPSLLYLDGSRCCYMSRAPGSAESPGAASFFLTRVLRTFATSDKITSIEQVIIRKKYHSQ